MQVIMRCMILQLGHMALGLKPGDAQPGSSLQAHLASSAALIAKVCSKCKMTKSASDFFRDKSKPDGMYSQVSPILGISSLMQSSSLHCRCRRMPLVSPFPMMILMAPA